MNSVTKPVWPEPLADAPVDHHSLALLNLAQQAREVSDSARGFMPRDGSRYDGTWFGDAMRFMRDAEELVAAVVVAERAHGATWDQLAEAAELAKSTVHKRWAPAEADWQERLDRAETEALEAPLHPDRQLWPVLGQDPYTVAARVDEWVARHAEVGDLPRASDSISALVQRMDPLAEEAYLGRQRKRLLDTFMVPPPVLQAPLAERQAVLDDALAEHAATAHPRQAAELRVSAEKNRAHAAQLRRQAAAGDTGTTWDALGGQDIERDHDADVAPS